MPKSLRNFFAFIARHQNNSVAARPGISARCAIRINNNIVRHLFLISSCGNNTPPPCVDTIPQRDTTYTSIVVGDFEISAPSFLKQTTELDTAATLQLADYDQELYLMVYRESIFDFIQKEKPTSDSLLEKYLASSLQHISETSHIQSDTLIRAIKIKTLDAKLLSYSGFVEGVEFPIYYQYAFIQGKTSLYTIICWTLDERKNEHQEKMEKMLLSFNERF
jgi:hypothetical protein